MNSPSPPDVREKAQIRLVLRFISGKYQGAEFPLNEGSPIIVGRAVNLDMALLEEMVSRKHARIEVRDGVVHVEDLGSTNGTFVNGERIQRATLRLGDRLMIGTSLLKLVHVDHQGGMTSDLEQVPLRKATTSQPAQSPSSRMSGALDEIPLPDLLQLFGSSRKSGVLVIHSTKVGRILLSEGLIQHASIEGSPEVHPLKCAYRMLSWTHGTFALEPPGKEEPSERLGLSAQEFLMEGFRLVDELNKIRTLLPELDQRLVLKSPLDAPLHDLEQAQLNILQLAINSPSLEVVLDRSPRGDLETLKAVVELMHKGYVEPAR